MSETLDNQVLQEKLTPIEASIKKNQKIANQFRISAIGTGAVSLVNTVATAFNLIDAHDNNFNGSPVWAVVSVASAVTLGAASNLLFAESRYHATVAANLEAQNTIQKLS